MQMLRGLHFFALEHAFHFIAAHIAGTANGPADVLSYYQASLFTSQVPQAPQIPDTMSEDIL